MVNQIADLDIGSLCSPWNFWMLTDVFRLEAKAMRHATFVRRNCMLAGKETAKRGSLIVPPRWRQPPPLVIIGSYSI